MVASETTNLDTLFYPKSIAVVGASPSENARANQWIRAFIHLNYQGRLFPINPRVDHVLAYKAYPSLLDVPDDIDLAIFAVPFQVVIPVMKDCVKKGVKFVHLFTAGFSETGEKEHAAMEEELIRIARKGGVRLLGPNCMGVYSPAGGVGWMDQFPKKAGPVGFVSQSGQLASQFIRDGSVDGLRFSKVASYGNAGDLQCHDFLDYLARDEDTRIIGCYIEGLKNGEAFARAARKITTEKPLIVWKGGQTEGGARATQSHTASIAGSSKIWQALCQQAGLIQVHTMEELISTTLGLLRLPPVNGNRVAILGGAGGGSVTMTDLAEKEGLQVPHLAEETIQKLKQIIPVSGTSVKNPLDIGFSSVYKDENLYLKLYQYLGEDPNIDAILFSRNIFRARGSGGRADLDFLVRNTMKGIEISGKPVLVILERGLTLEWEALREEAAARYNNAGIATFRSFQIAARVLSNLYQYREYVKSRP